MKYILIYFAIKYDGNFEKIYDALKRKEYVDPEDIEEIYNKCQTKEIDAITIIDNDYPDSLKKIFRPPFVLFYKGNINILKKNIINITGHNNNTNELSDISMNAEYLSLENALITTNFKKFDNEIINIFSKNDIPIIYISSNGIDNGFFHEKIKLNTKNQLILSETPSNLKVSKRKLIERNRLIAGLSNVLIIYNSKKDSGIMNLVNFFLENGKEIYCNILTKEKNEGNNILIKDGANSFKSLHEINEIIKIKTIN